MVYLILGHPVFFQCWMETFGLSETLGYKPTLDFADTLLKFYLISKSNNDTLQDEYPLNKRLLHAA